MAKNLVAPGPTDSQVPILGGSSVRLLVPRGLSGLPPFSFDMTEVYRIESRLPEVRVVNCQTYQELAGDFNVGYNALSRIITAIEFEIMTLKNEMDRLKSRLLIDDYPDFYVEKKKKGLTDNAELRRSYFLRNPDYSMSTDKLSSLEALAKFTTMLQQAFKNGYQAAKKVVDAKNGGGFGVY